MTPSAETKTVADRSRGLLPAEPISCEPLPPVRIGWRETVGSAVFLTLVFAGVLLI